MIQYRLQAGNQLLERGMPFNTADMSYPANWLDLANDDDLTAHGIVKETVQDAPGPGLDAIKSALMGRVNEDAEGVRLRYITPGSGQAMTYLEKHNQAVAVHEMGQSPAGSLPETEYRSMFPTLAASVGIEAATLWECADIVIARYEAWVTISFLIERTKLAGKQAISIASDAAAAQAAYEAITWPNP